VLKHACISVSFCRMTFDDDSVAVKRNDVCNTNLRNNGMKFVGLNQSALLDAMI